MATNPLDKVYLSQEQLETLASGGSIPSGDDEYTADKDTLYLIPSEGVDSVNGKTGDVVLNADDISDTNTTNKFTNVAEKSAWNAKSTVSVASTGTATDEVKFITIDGTEKKLAGGVEIDDTITALNKTWSSSKISSEITNAIQTSIITALNTPV